VGQESEALRVDIAQRRESMTDTIDAIEDRVVPSRIIERRRTAFRSWVGGAKERVMGSAHAAGDQASSTASKVGDGMSHATDAVTNAPQQVQRATAGSPLIAGAVAFGIGALVAVLLPESGPEQRAVAAVQPQLAAAADAVKDAGQQAIETAKTSAQDAAQQFKSSATEHAHEVSDEAKSAAAQVKDTAQQGDSTLS
jgi:gas vesicle protein